MPKASTGQRKFTDRLLKSIKGARNGKPYDVRDTEVRGLRLRVMGSGERTFVLLARYSRDANPTRRALGSYPAMSLAQAREKAVHWKNQLKAGVDPSAEEARRRENSFAAVAEQFIAYIQRQKLRTAPVMERNLRETFIKRAKWGARPIADIRSDDVKRVIRNAVDRGATYQAFRDFALIRRLFNWAIGTDDYGLESNPLSPSQSERPDRPTTRPRPRTKRRRITSLLARDRALQLSLRPDVSIAVADRATAWRSLCSAMVRAPPCPQGMDDPGRANEEGQRWRQALHGSTHRRHAHSIGHLATL